MIFKTFRTLDRHSNWKDEMFVVLSLNIVGIELAIISLYLWPI